MSRSFGVLRMTALVAGGLIIAAMPIALWLAWPHADLVLGVGAGTVFLLLLCVLHLERRTASRQQQKADPRTMEDLDDAFLSQLSNMQPFVYHNRKSADPGFRRKMAHLKAKLANH